MSDLEPAMREYLLAAGTVSSVVGNRAYPLVLPQSPTLPAYVYQRVDTRRLHDLNGPDNLPRARVQLTAWGASIADATNAATVARVRLDGYKGTWRDIKIGSCLLVAERQMRENETNRVAVIHDYMIQFEEA